MNRIFLSIFRNRFFKMLVFIVFFETVFIGNFGFANTGNQSDNTTKTSPPPNSLAWQLDELTKWLIQTRYQTLNGKTIEPPFYVLNSLKLTGSVEKNRLSFSMKGSMISEQPILVPLFGPPDRVILTNITINNQPAVVGFEKKDYYFVRTEEKDFTINGEISLLNQLNFTVPGPINLFLSDFSDGRVVEGEQLPGLENATLHLETGKKNETAKSDVSPLFQLSRALRIQKEITFEYQVKVRSGKEISQVSIPMKFSEIVLDVPGKKGWKMEKGNLVVPASGRNVSFTVTGRLPKAGVFRTDERSSYEWWLIESDVEHRVNVDTSGKHVDASKSPLKKKLSSSRLFLLSRGQEIAVTIHPLKTLDALAVVIPSQYRKIIWTKNGELVAEDRVIYGNNGLDYIPFDCKGKPIYFEADEEARTILSENPAQKSQILVPLKKGGHSFKVQSISKAKPSLFGGFLQIPTADHNLTVSRSSVRLGLPSGIFPVWFFGGEQINPLFDWKDLIFTGITLLFVFLFFRGYKVRIAGFISFIGFYIIFPKIYIFLCFCLFVVFLLFLAKRNLKGWKQWIVFGIISVAVVVLALYLSSFFEYAKLRHNMLYPSVSGSGGISTLYAGLKFPKEVEFEMQYGEMRMPWEGRRIKESEDTDSMEENTIRGVIPVPLPLPEFERSVTVTKELVTKDQTLTPTLFYVTTITIFPLILCWLFCWGYVGFCNRQKINRVLEQIKKIWKKGGDS